MASSSQWSASRTRVGDLGVLLLRSGRGSGCWATVLRAMSRARSQFTGPSYGCIIDWIWLEELAEVGQRRRPRRRTARTACPKGLARRARPEAARWSWPPRFAVGGRRPGRSSARGRPYARRDAGLGSSRARARPRASRRTARRPARDPARRRRGARRARRRRRRRARRSSSAASATTTTGSGVTRPGVLRPPHRARAGCARCATGSPRSTTCTASPRCTGSAGSRSATSPSSSRPRRPPWRGLRRVAGADRHAQGRGADLEAPAVRRRHRRVGRHALTPRRSRARLTARTAVRFLP